MDYEDIQNKAGWRKHEVSNLSVKCLTCKHEDLSSIPPKPTRKEPDVAVRTCHLGEGVRRWVKPWGLLVGQPRIWWAPGQPYLEEGGGAGGRGRGRGVGVGEGRGGERREERNDYRGLTSPGSDMRTAHLTESYPLYDTGRAERSIWATLFDP